MRERKIERKSAKDMRKKIGYWKEDARKSNRKNINERIFKRKSAKEYRKKIRERVSKENPRKRIFERKSAKEYLK